MFKTSYAIFNRRHRNESVCNFSKHHFKNVHLPRVSRVINWGFFLGLYVGLGRGPSSDSNYTGVYAVQGRLVFLFEGSIVDVYTLCRAVK